MNRRRFVFILLFGVLLYTVTLLRLLYMQVFKGKHFSELSKRNYVRSRILYPKRGDILDRKGEKIAYDIPRYILFMDPQKIEDIEGLRDTIKTLNEIYGLNLDEEKLKGRLRGYEAIYIKSLDSQEELDKFYNNAFRIPGVYVNVVPQRFYPYGEVCSHLTGYVSLPTDRELSKYKDRIANESLVGQSGVEKAFDNTLLGMVGKEDIMVDAAGRPVKNIGKSEPQNGNTLVLSIDLRIQKIAFDVFRESGQKAGALIVMHAKTGEVLALLSYPCFDPNKIREEWENYSNNKYKPLFNRALLGRYPPASVIKPALALSLLMNGISPQDAVTCSGRYLLGNRYFYCWNRRGHGVVSMKKAIYASCDTYFYHFGYYKLGYKRIEGTLRAFSYAQGIPFELPTKRGFIPTPEWKRKVLRKPWYGGDTVNMSIGQGYIKSTLMEQSMMMMGIVNNGVMYRPTIVREIRSSDGQVIVKSNKQVYRVFNAPQEYFAIVREALRETVTKGTATSANSHIVEIAGKTGTAQVASASSRYKNLPYHLRDHAWFVGFAPYKDPIFVIGVIVEHGGSGGSVAAPIARKVLERIYIEGIHREIS